MHQVWNTIAQFHMLESGDRVLLGVSGGPDSVALLHLLHSKANDIGISLHVVHINHMLREEAVTEANYVQSLALQYNLPFRLYTVDVSAYAREHGMSLEQAGHAVRFQCFQDAKAHWDINKLALGHHKGDRAESLLIHILQGCGLDGVVAMPPKCLWEKQDQSYIIRPLAQSSKQELLDYCAEHELQYFIDESNLEPLYLRNQVRLELLPQMEQYNPQIEDALIRLQDSCSADLDYLNQQTERLWEQYGRLTNEGVMFSATVFRTQHLAMQRRLLRMMYQQWTGSTIDLNFSQVEQMRMIAMQENGTQQLSLTKQRLFVRQYDTLWIKNSIPELQEQASMQWQYRTEQELCWYDGRFIAEIVDKCSAQMEKGFDVILADAACLGDVLTIRNRKPGDSIQPIGMHGHKKVKKLLIDAKVPLEDRNRLPMVLSGDEIVWIPGYFMADCIKITEKTKRIYKLSFS